MGTLRYEKFLHHRTPASSIYIYIKTVIIIISGSGGKLNDVFNPDLTGRRNFGFGFLFAMVIPEIRLAIPYIPPS